MLHSLLAALQLVPGRSKSIQGASRGALGGSANSLDQLESLPIHSPLFCTIHACLRVTTCLAIREDTRAKTVCVTRSATRVDCFCLRVRHKQRGRPQLEHDGLDIILSTRPDRFRRWSDVICLAHLARMWNEKVLYCGACGHPRYQHSGASPNPFVHVHGHTPLLTSRQTAVDHACRSSQSLCLCCVLALQQNRQTSNHVAQATDREDQAL